MTALPENSLTESWLPMQHDTTSEPPAYPLPGVRLYFVEHGTRKRMHRTSYPTLPDGSFTQPVQQENAPIVAPAPVAKQRCTHV